MNVVSLPRDWIKSNFLCLLFQNLISEEREDIREASLVAWQTALLILSTSVELMTGTVARELILQWFTTIMTPLGAPIDTNTFYRPNVNANGEWHNVDKNMLSQDLSLITIEVTLKARIAAASALARLMACWPDDVSVFLVMLITCPFTQFKCSCRNRTTPSCHF
jgi:TATA-binding protein-associated factor